MPETILPRGSDSFERQSGARFEVIIIQEDRTVLSNRLLPIRDDYLKK